MAPRVKLAYDNGFQVASHTWSHAHLSELNPGQGKLTVNFLLFFLLSLSTIHFFSRFGNVTDRGCVFFFVSFFPAELGFRNFFFVDLDI